MCLGGFSFLRSAGRRVPQNGQKWMVENALDSSLAFQDVGKIDFQEGTPSFRISSRRVISRYGKMCFRARSQHCGCGSSASVYISRR
jgi:hypothetical protein